jgi:hypothetical protein
MHLANGDQVLFDFGAMRDPDDENDKRCDLPSAVRKDMEKAKRDFFAAVAFTHLDNDHVIERCINNAIVSTKKGEALIVGCNREVSRATCGFFRWNG